jgi:putative redox protein
MATTVTAELQLAEGMRFNVRTSSGHDVVVDTDAGAGGSDLGPRPIELLLVSLGGCGAMDTISILRKMRQDVTSYDIRVEGQRRDEHPRVYTSITVTHRLEGHALAEASVRRAIELSVSRYCAAFAMLSKAAPIDVRYEIIDAETRAVTPGTVATAGVLEATA